MKILWGTVVLLIAGGTVGCASIGPPTAPSLELPKPPTDLKVSRKGDRVTLSWTIPKRTMDRQSVRYLGKTQVCRNVTDDHAAADRTTTDQTAADQTPADQAAPPQSATRPSSATPRPNKTCGTVIGSVVPPADFLDTRKTAKRLPTTYVDTLPSTIEAANPYGFATYGVEVMNEAGRGAGLSNLARVPLVPTMAPFADFAAQTEARGVMITWVCPPGSPRTSRANYLFRIYRRTTESAVIAKIADIDATDCIAGESHGRGNIITSFLDSSIEWEKTYFYRGTVVSVIEGAGKPVEVEGDDTPEVKLFAHDVFPPAVPKGLQAVYSGPGQQVFIDLIWAPVTDADLAGYNVYRREAAENRAAAMTVNSELVTTPAYRDTTVVAGKTYFYSVSAVDRQGNESARSEEASEKVP